MILVHIQRNPSLSADIWIMNSIGVQATYSHLLESLNQFELSSIFKIIRKMTKLECKYLIMNDKILYIPDIISKWSFWCYSICAEMFSVMTIKSIRWFKSPSWWSFASNGPLTLSSEISGNMSILPTRYRTTNMSFSANCQLMKLILAVKL